MIKRLIWLMPGVVHDLIWAVSGHVLMGWRDEKGEVVKLEWKILRNGVYS